MWVLGRVESGSVVGIGGGDDSIGVDVAGGCAGRSVAPDTGPGVSIPGE